MRLPPGMMPSGLDKHGNLTITPEERQAIISQSPVHYKDTKRFTQMRKMELRYNDIETNASTYQTFNLALSVGFRATVMGTRVKVNGVTQINKSPWTNTSGVDYYFSNNYRKINIRKPHAPSGVAYGVTLIDGDVIIKVGEYYIKDIYAYMNALSNFKDGDEIILVILRNGKEIEFKVKF